MGTISEFRLRVLVLNAFAIPGLGHIYAKQYLSGTVMAVAFTPASLYFIVEFFLKAWLFFKTGADLATADRFLISLLADPLTRYSIIVAGLTWLVSVLDGYRITRGK